MTVTRFFNGTAAVSIAVASVLAGCSSVEPMAETAGLAPQPNASAATTDEKADGVALAKTGRLEIAVPEPSAAADAQATAMASSEMAPQVGYATTEPASATTAAAAIQTLASAPSPQQTQQAGGDASASRLRAQAIALDEEEPTPDMQALQAVIPTPRPDLPGLAYAAEPKAAAVLASLDAGTQFPPAPGDPLPETASASTPEMTRLIKRYAGLYGVPESLIHRVVHRESRYDPKAYHKDGYWGLMQIKYATAKSMGYSGPPEGLLDAETNLKYAVKYLRGAWLVADNSNDNAIRLYARGYYYDAKRRGMLHVLK